MKIAVLVKQVPDTWSPKQLGSDLRCDRTSADAVLNDLDEYAIEAALQAASSTSGHVTAITMGPNTASDTVRKALAMGADAGIHLCDDQLAGADLLATATALAAIINQHHYDLIFCGDESTDARTAALPAMIAELTGVNAILSARNIDTNGDGVTATIDLPDATCTVRSAGRCLVSVAEKANEPRYPSFKGIMAAKKKPLDTITLADLNLDTTAISNATRIDSSEKTPPRENGTIITDTGDAGAQLATWLINEARLTPVTTQAGGK